MFPTNPNYSEDPIESNRHTERYQVQFARNARLYNSVIPAMQRQLNQDYNSRKTK